MSVAYTACARIFASIAIALIVSSTLAPLHAQTQSGIARTARIDSDYQASVAEIYDKIAMDFGLHSLWNRTADTIQFELRIWHAKGFGSPEGWVIRRDRASWRAFRAIVKDGRAPLQPLSAPLPTSWESVYSQLRDMGLLELATFDGPRDGMQSADGQLALIELRESRTYRNWTYDLRIPTSSPDMQRVVQILEFMRRLAP